MKSHSFPTETGSRRRSTSSRMIQLLIGTALISTTIVANAAGKVVRTPHGDVAVLQAPQGVQQTLKATHPFATATQRAAVKPLPWYEGKAAPIEPQAVQKPSGPVGKSAGGAAPSFGNYMARNQFPEAWKAVDAAVAAEAQSQEIKSGDISTQDGAHYSYYRYPGNYYTSQWTAPPWNKIGKLYFNTPSGGSSYCTANVASGNSVLITAAHCVYTRGQGWNSNFVFVPAERYGAAPYGSYGWSSASVMNSWITDGGRRWDVAVIRLTGEASSGLPVVNYVGWLGRSWNYGYEQYTYSHGYASNLSTQYTNICSGRTYSSGWEGTNVLVQGCDMTYGSSGGGWLINYTPNSHGGNHVNSVVSGPHIGAFGSAYVGARFNDDNIVPLCNAIGC